MQKYKLLQLGVFIFLYSIKQTGNENGELMYQFKYNREYLRLTEIINVTVGFLDNCHIMNSIDVILPVPPSKTRMHQPVFEIASRIAEHYNIYYTNNMLIKNIKIESKNMNAEEKHKLSNSISFVDRVNQRCNILLIDDIFETGKTLNECVRVLKTDDKIDKIYALAITKFKGED